MLSCSVMAVRLRNGDQQAASDALSTSLLIAGACGLAILFILEVICLVDLPVCMHLMKCYGRHGFCPSVLIGTHGGTLVPFLQRWGLALIAKTGCAAALVPPAWEYTRIRALAAPAVLVSMVAQVMSARLSWAGSPQ